MYLNELSDSVTLTTSSASAVGVRVAFTDLTSGTRSGRLVSAISTATETNIVPQFSIGGGGSGVRRIESISISNSGASPNTVTVSFDNGAGTKVAVWQCLLNAKESATYDGTTFRRFDADGNERTTTVSGQLSPTVNTLNTVVLSGDVINNNATPNTLQDVTGLSFAVVAGQSYWFRFVVDYTAALTATGSRWTLNGPSTTRLAYRSQYSLAATTVTSINAVAYGIPAASNTASATTAGNVSIVEGFITPSDNGTVQLRFASETGGSAITAKAGSILQWIRTV